VLQSENPVETDDGEFLVFDPDAADEKPAVLVSFWCDVDHIAADFAEEFAAAVIELVIIRGEAAEIGKGHGEETERLEGPEKVSGFGVVHDGKQTNVLGEIGLPEEIKVVGGAQTQRFISFGALDVGFDDRLPAYNFALNLFFAGEEKLAELLGCGCSGSGVSSRG